MRWCCLLQYFVSFIYYSSPCCCGKHHQQASIHPCPCQIGDPAPVPPANAVAVMKCKCKSGAWPTLSTPPAVLSASCQISDCAAQLDSPLSSASQRLPYRARVRATRSPAPCTPCFVFSLVQRAVHGQHGTLINPYWGQIAPDYAALSRPLGCQCHPQTSQMRAWAGLGPGPGLYY